MMHHFQIALVSGGIKSRLGSFIVDDANGKDGSRI